MQTKCTWYTWSLIKYADHMQLFYKYIHIYPLTQNNCRKLPWTVKNEKLVWDIPKLLLTSKAYSPLILMLVKLTSSSEYVLVSVCERLGSDAGNTSPLLWLHTIVSGVGLPSKVQFSTSVEFTVNVVFPGVNDKVFAGSANM